MPREQLYFAGVSEIVGGTDVALIILADKSRTRQLSIVCDRSMAVQIELRVKAVPITTIMLPEVLSRLLRMDKTAEYIFFLSLHGTFTKIETKDNTLCAL